MKINGTNFTIWIPDADTSNDSSTTLWYPIGGSTSCSVNINVDTPDATTKDSSGWEEVIGGMKSWDGTFDNFLDFDISGFSVGSETYAGFADIYDYLVARNPIKIAFGQEGATNLYWYGDAYITNLSITADKEATVPFNGSFKGTGTLTKSSAADIEAAASYPI